MFFKYFKRQQGENSRLLFFNRNRASLDYRQTKSTFLPQFGFTEAISYNHEKLFGVAPVLVGQVLSGGVFAKAGIQYVLLKKDLVVFSWLVSETTAQPDLDYFLLLRYTPALSMKVKLFTQIESVNVFPTAPTGNYSFTQRMRLGASIKSFQFGIGADVNETSHSDYTSTYNMGGFIRHEF